MDTDVTTDVSRLVIDRRFHGPRDSGNGGYVAGRLAAFIGGTVEITLRAPPPLERPLMLMRNGDALELRDGDLLLAAARPASLALDIPALPAEALMEEAAAAGGSDESSDFHQCFVCGRGRVAGDGLRVWAGRIPGGGVGMGVAVARWTPDAALAGADGYLPDEFLWGALDCPGATAVLGEDDDRTVLTGRMTGRVERRLRAGEPATVLAWPIAADGRKLTSGTAVIDQHGQVCARALTLWIVLKN